MKKTLLFALALAGAIVLPAQDLDTTLDHYLDEALTKFHIPDLEVLVIDQTDIIYQRSVGQSSPASSYYIGSVSKSLTALGVLKLIEQTELELDSKVVDILPEIAFEHSGTDITIRHLLTHTSGISKKAGFSYLPTLKELQSSNHSIENKNIDPLRHEYSNLNYSLLGLIIEKTSDQSFAEYMQNEVFTPLEMSHSHIGSRASLAPHLIKHYQYFGPFAIERDQLDFAATSIPAGFISSSAQDLGNYLQMNLNGGQFNGQNILDSTLLSQMHTVWDESDFGYTMGWKQGYYNEQKFYQHLGSTANSYSGIFFLPEKELGFILLTNSNSFDFSENLAEGILGILSGGSSKRASSYEYFFRLGILFAFAFLSIKFFYQLFIIFRKQEVIHVSKIIKDLGVLSMFLIALILAFPYLTQVRFGSFFKLQPDIGLLILTSFVLPIILALIKLVKVKMS